MNEIVTVNMSYSGIQVVTMGVQGPAGTNGTNGIDSNVTAHVGATIALDPFSSAFIKATISGTDYYCLMYPAGVIE